MYQKQTELVNKITEFRKLVIQAIFSDDDLCKLFSLKGGSALDLIHNITYRSSMDVDIAMKDDILPKDIPIIESKLKSALQEIFNAYDPPYSIFQFKFEPRPAKQNLKANKFWGGYSVEFKIRSGIHPIDDVPDSQKAAREAEVVDFTQGKKFEIDISKYEFTNPSEFKDLEGYTIKVYTLEMIIYEKLRAICQKLPGYAAAHTTINARPKDFYDIFMIMRAQQHISFASLDIEVLKTIFEKKEVPLALLFDIPNHKQEVFDEGIEQLKETFLNDELDTFNPNEVFDFIINGINEIPGIDEYYK